jgi:outer membrane protein OmpA-like peptidoglycan-associated protein
MKSNSNIKTFSILAGLFLGVAAQAQPQDCDPNDPRDLLCKRFQLERLELASASGDFVTTEGTAIPEAKNFSFKVLTSFQHNPLTIKTVVDGKLQDEAIAIVSEQTVMQLGGMIGLGKQLAAGLVVPLILSQAGDGLSELSLPGGDLSSAGLGDFRFSGRYRVGSWKLTPDQTFAVAASGTISVPMSQLLDNAVSNDFFGERHMTFTPRASAEFTQGPLRVGANLAYRIRPKSNMLSLTINDELLYNLAVGYQLSNELSASLELFGGASSFEAGEVDQRPAEIDASGRYTIKGGLYAMGGAGLGISRGAMSPNFRLFASLGFSLAPRVEVDSDGDGFLDSKDDCPQEPETENNYKDKDGCPDDEEETILDENDEDADNILNKDDKCPTQPEDADRFEDEDGCPEFDNDKDGPHDNVDKCPDEPEDKDGFEDEDGCPDPNNDGDPIDDVADKCPNEPEDLDGLADGDGCPETDADNDTFADDSDPCPDAAENLNGNADDDGCPDAGTSVLVFPQGGVGVITGSEKIQFQAKKAQITPDSLPVLDELVSRMKYSPQAHLVIVVAPEKKKSKATEALAKQRAESLMNYLIGFGVEADRVRIQVGPVDQPLKLELLKVDAPAQP